jgi:hypothetical protein
MFNWFRKKEPEGDRVNDLANRLMKEGRTSELERELELLDRSTLNQREIETWHHLYGVAAFSRADRDLARKRFVEAHERFPKSALITFSLGQEYEYAGRPAAMFEMFDLAQFPSVFAKYALAESRYAYLWGDIDRAIQYLNPVLKAHYSLGIADDTFLYIRGMPFFSETWAYLAAFHEILGHFDAINKLTQTAIARLRDFNFAPLQAFIRAIQANDFSSYAAQAAAATGYERVRAAVITAKSASSFAEAGRVLDDVMLAANDFPWLSDMLLLSRCEAAHRHEPSLERALVDSFLARQPLLFEPDHVFNFRLVAYQEHLKTIFRSRRQQPSMK